MEPSKAMKRFIEWDSIDVRVDGERLNTIVAEIVAKDPMLERLALKFSNGLLRVEGSVRKFISIPFSVEITQIEGRGTTVRVPLARISAGPIPVPTLLLGLVRDRLPRELVSYEEPATLVFSLKPFLPPFITAEIQKVWILDGGLAVSLGRGGADLPAGGLHGPEHG